MVICVADGCAIATLPAATLAPVGKFCAPAGNANSGAVSAVVANSLVARRKEK
jgi:hypothetical protein